MTIVGDKPRMFGGLPESVPLPWAWAEDRLTRAPLYWIATTRRDGRPHSRPVWAVYFEGRVRFSTGSLGVVNLQRSPEISVQVQLQAGGSHEVVIVEGTAELVTDRPLVVRICDVYNAKYRYNLEPDSLPGPFWGVVARTVFGWVSDDTGADGGAAFQGTTTRWRP